jgi:hypothetical protein
MVGNIVRLAFIDGVRLRIQLKIVQLSRSSDSAWSKGWMSLACMVLISSRSNLNRPGERSRVTRHCHVDIRAIPNVCSCQVLYLSRISYVLRTIVVETCIVQNLPFKVLTTPGPVRRLLWRVMPHVHVGSRVRIENLYWNFKLQLGQLT